MPENPTPPQPPRHLSMIRGFHLADFVTLGNAACGTAGVFLAMVYVGSGELSDFLWADTGERITDYHARHSVKATRLERFLCSRRFWTISFVVGGVLGAILGFLMFRDNILMLKIFMTGFVAFLGVFTAGAINVYLLGKLIAWRVCGVMDTRALQ